MRMFDIHELEDHITEVLQSMQGTGQTVAVTKGGEIIAHLVPASTPSLLAKPPDDDFWTNRIKSERDARRSETTSAVDDLQEAWNNFDRLVTELGVQWPEGVDAVDAVREVRREL
jgi:antitoxin (DNA-binding transcriptional repressor) of toxin-antitoxin stability system